MASLWPITLLNIDYRVLGLGICALARCELLIAVVCLNRWQPMATAMYC